MTKFFPTLLGAMALTLAIAPAAKADESFDLSSQRSEEQTVNRVPGHKVDHQGLVINPTPQSLTRGQGKLNASRGFNISAPRGTEIPSFIKTTTKGGARLTVSTSGPAADKAGVKDVDGAYVLTISPKGAAITARDADGVYYAFQTLRQLIGSPASADGLPALTINDYPSMKYRGIVEGFYGTPWSHEKRLSLLDFYGRNKLNNYIYGPKDDPYHSSPYWRQPYPEKEARQIHELVEAAKRNHVRFVWAIHPGKDIRWTKEDYDSLVNKFQIMYNLGVRDFAVFFDDIDGIGTDPARQAQLINDLTRDFVKPKGDVGNIMICPTDYSQAWAKPGPDGPLAIYGRDLNPAAEVFWTGAVVCSDLTPETLEFINSRIKRPALYWWNYPVTDYCRPIMMQGPVYGLDTTLTPEQVAGIESNPMEHAEASKIALYGVADYAWNTSAYNPIDNWERGLVNRLPDAHDAYRTFAIHSTDTETGYRRDESWETTIFPFNNYTPAQFDALRAEYQRVAEAPAALRASKSNPALIDELNPWLTQFEGVGQRGLRTLGLIEIYNGGNDSLFWQSYLDNLMTPEQKADFEAHKVGTMKLHPFYENSMEDMLKAFYEKIAGRKPSIYKGVGSYVNMTTNQPKLMLDADTTTFYTSALSQADGDWIGVDLGELRPVDEVIVHQGRNSVDDTDYFERVILEASPDGRIWKPLTDSLERTYIVTYAGEPVDARYVRLRRLPSAKNSWAAVRTFRVNPVSMERIGLNIASTDPVAALLAFDNDPSTIYNLDGELAFDRPSGANQLIVLAGNHAGPLTFVQFDEDGKTLSETSIPGTLISMPLDSKCARLAIKGKAPIYELVTR